MQISMYRNTILWASYDFANSIVYIIFFLYFSQWIIIDRHMSDLWLNSSFALAAFLLILFSPLVVTYLNKGLKSIFGLRIATIGMVFGYGGAAVCALHDNALGALIFFTLGLFCYFLSFLFYLPLLPIIADQQHLGLISGIGMAANFLGNIVGLVLALPMATGRLSFFHSVPRAETLLPAVIIFFICALPILIFFKQPDASHDRQLPHTAQHNPGIDKKIWLYFGGFFLVNSSIVTLTNNFPIILERLWHIPDVQKTFVIIGIVAMSTIGSLIAGMLSDRFGHHRILLVAVFLFTCTGLLSAITFSFFWYTSEVVIIGFLIGSLWALFRSSIIFITPKNHLHTVISYYNIIDKSSSLIGPILWSIVLIVSKYNGLLEYRPAICGMMIISAIGWFIFLFLAMPASNTRCIHD